MAVRIPNEELLKTPLELGVTYEVRFSISPAALTASPEDLKGSLESALPIEVRYLGPSPADPKGLFCVIFIASGFPPPSADLTEQENRSLAYITWLIGREIKRHCRQGLVPTLSYRTDVWVHDEGDGEPEPVPEPPPPLIPLPHPPDLGRLLNALKWMGIAGATLLGGRYLGVKGAIAGGLIATVLLEPKEVQELGKTIERNAGWLLAGGLLVGLLLWSGRNVSSSERKPQPV